MARFVRGFVICFSANPLCDLSAKVIMTKVSCFDAVADCTFSRTSVGPRSTAITSRWVPTTAREYPLLDVHGAEVRDLGRGVGVRLGGGGVSHSTDSQPAIDMLLFASERFLLPE